MRCDHPRRTRRHNDLTEADEVHCPDCGQLIASVSDEMRDRVAGVCGDRLDRLMDMHATPPDSIR